MPTTAKVKFKHEVSEDNAAKMWEWLKSRGGIAVWMSADLSNPGASWSTPATIRRGDCDGSQAAEGSPDDILPYPKPNWQCGNTPEIITDPADVGVFTDALYKAFRVGLKRGCGYSVLLSDGAQRKVDKAMSDCREKHGDAFYRRGVLDIEGASMGIYWTTGIIPISEWAKKKGLA